ncbi:RNase H domain-containing protein [Trichonephila clavipes]|nr:RNase H domain-containing protein [Trichonephila clavipes]
MAAVDFLHHEYPSTWAGFEPATLVYFCASEDNLNKLERVQPNAERIVTGLRNSCPNNIVLYESDLPPLSMRRSHILTELLTRMCKKSDIPEFTGQISLEIIHGIPHSVSRIYSEGSMGDSGISGGGVYIEKPGATFDIKIRDIWILIDSRASMQHLSRWTTVGDVTSLNILDLVARLSSRYSKYFQWVSSLVGLNGNEIADSLAKSATDETLRATRGLLETDHVILNHGQVKWMTPELAPPLLTTTPHQREDVSALDRFNVHRCPTWRVFSGTRLELVTRQAMIRSIPIPLSYHGRLPPLKE